MHFKFKIYIRKCINLEMNISETVDAKERLERYDKIMGEFIDEVNKNIKNGECRSC